MADSKVRILIINDRHSLVWFAERILQKEGFEVLTAFDGLEGLQKARQEKPDLIILDTIMPRMDGYNVYHQLQKDPETARLPVLFTTIKGEAYERRIIASGSRSSTPGRKKPAERQPAGTLDFLMEPLTDREMVDRVQSLLQVSALKAETEVAEVKTTKPRILIIDDDHYSVRLTESALLEAGFDVLTAFDGLRGLKKAREEKPDLIILDIILPELNGLQILKFMRRESSIPVIILTERSEVDLVKKALSLGADGYVIKPFATDDLLSRIHAKLTRVEAKVT